MTDRTSWAANVRRIMVADYMETSRQVLVDVLVAAGVAVNAIDPSDGSDVLEQRFAGPPPELLIITRYAPAHEPAAVVSAIRAREVASGTPPVPIAVLAADADASLQGNPLEAAIDYRLHKPMSAIEVVAAARTLMTRVPRQLARVVAIDDDALDVLVLQRIFSRVMPDVDVEGFTDPDLGLVRVLASPWVDLLFVNGLMPGLDGPELIARVRQAEAGAGRQPVPIVITSTSTWYLERGLDAGADLPLRLPHSGNDLRMCVRALFPEAPWNKRRDAGAAPSET